MYWHRCPNAVDTVCPKNSTWIIRELRKGTSFNAKNMLEAQGCSQSLPGHPSGQTSHPEERNGGNWRKRLEKVKKTWEKIRENIWKWRNFGKLMVLSCQPWLRAWPRLGGSFFMEHVTKTWKYPESSCFLLKNLVVVVTPLVSSSTTTLAAVNRIFAAKKNGTCSF